MCKNLIKKFLVTFSLIFLALSSQGIGPSVPAIKKGASVQIRSWDPQVKAVELKIVNESAIGPNFADINAFIAALGLTGEEASAMRKSPGTKKGVVFNLKNKLKLLNYNELKARLPKDVRKKVEKKEALGRAKAKKAAAKKSK